MKLVKNKYALLAQLVEQLPLKEMVGGSIPSRGTNKKICRKDQIFLFVPRSEQTALLA